MFNNKSILITGGTGSLLVDISARRKEIRILGLFVCVETGPSTGHSKPAEVSEEQSGATFPGESATSYRLPRAT